MSAPYWADNSAESSAWNTCILGSVFLPGIVTVDGFKISRDVDVKKTKGQDGATMTDNGIEPAKGTITVDMPSKVDWELFQQILPEIHPRKPGGTRTPLEIVHPLPNLLGVKNIYVSDVQLNKPSARSGARAVLEVIEWFPAPKPIKKAAGKKNAAGTLTPAKAAETYYPQKGSALRTADPTPFAPTGLDALDNAFGERR